MKSKTFSFSFLILFILLTFTKLSAQNNSGTDFWVTFSKNFDNNGVTLSLFITSDVNTSGTVSVPGQGFSTPFSVTANQITTVVIPFNVGIVNTNDGIENRGINIISNDPVTVYGLNRISFTTDAYLAFPTNTLGQEHIVLSYRNTFVDDRASVLFAIVGTEDNTTVTIIPSVTTGTRLANIPYNIILNQGEVYQLRNNQSSSADLSGTIITSTKPVSVFGGHTCVNIPSGANFCDLITQQLPPTSTWGKSFLTVPLKNRLNGDRFRFLAKEDNTTILINGLNVATINRAQFFETILTTSSTITSNEPILVAQYSHGRTFDNITGDPFMMLIPPFEQFLGAYTVLTPASGFNENFVNVVAPNAAVGLITLNSVAIPAASFSNIGSSGFSGAQVDIPIGSHNLAGPLPFGLFIYGFNLDDSYGYPGGQSFSPIAIVTSVELAPKTASKNVGQQHCVVATVKDQFGDPVVGVRVDFEATGANSAAGFANTLADGTAEFCYTGTSAGTDNIVASVGTLNDDASVVWNQAATVTTISLAPKTANRFIGQQHCVTATVQDQFGDPLEGVSVDFSVSGANSASGSVSTGSDGKAQFCYVGVFEGTDNIIAAAGALSDDASATWSEQVAIVCPFSQGYWRNHPSEWPLSAVPMLLGNSNSYSKAQLLNIFKTPPRGDASLILAHQLIAAKLNVANGSPVPSEVQDAIEDADDAIGSRSIPANVRPNSALGQTMTSIAKTLDMYNNKLLTPECLYEPEMAEKQDNQSLEEGLVLGNYPNPFNPVTQIRFSIPENNFVSLKVYNSVGQLVRTLVNENLNKGYHNVEWNATDDHGNKLSSGIYLYRLQAGELVQSHKMILMK